MDWTPIIIAAIGGGGIITGIVEIIKAIVDKKQTPYEMLKGVLEKMNELYEARSADYEREKLDGAEKSSVIMQSHFCKYKYTNPEIVCPVDKANDERLKNRCSRCSYPPAGEQPMSEDN